MQTIISCDELQAQLENPQWYIFDCRFSLMDVNEGNEQYLESHIPGATYVNLNSDLSAPHQPGRTGRHPLPEREDWLARVQDWGISPDVQVVVYDAAGGATAARMWWMLRWAGHDKVAVLDGAWQAWNSAGLPLSTEIPKQRPASHFDYSKQPSLCQNINVDELSINKHALIDARALSRFNGELEPIDPVAGHIPGAVCYPFENNLDKNGRFKTKKELRAQFSSLNLNQKESVCYCGSGVTAAHNILAFVYAGLEEPKLYSGSWSDWITDPAREIAKA